MNPSTFTTLSNIFSPQRTANPVPKSGNVLIEKFYGKRDKYHELEFEINETAYMVLFDVEPYNYEDLYNDFNVSILEVSKCHIKKDEYIVRNQIRISEFDLILNKVYDHWEKNMPDDFYSELCEDTDCKTDH
ncbi:MAG: hypothetical protein IPO16_14765 [Saprospiraceae bacterium]|nr:hypothetical protein [Saprospiraceae bacterium]